MLQTTTKEDTFMRSFIIMIAPGHIYNHNLTKPSLEVKARDAISSCT